ncbi:hypothetical protein SETIT_5G293000v2 [Setaria italica]|uniref:Late embryogenesis abundant protein LEA-2 subgroup domain-containing protein n=3 Tax=Setaria TaxID=4554 RepID=K3XQR7_SETIT|nr:hypothetical protein SETIT_5G293000v2 [Setaria italica]TKW16367.1 hypothetical protein SEVIR_5G295800v2 [Setaria viridis]
MALLGPFIYSVVAFYGLVVVLALARASETINGIINQDHPISSAVQLVGVKGLEPAMAPGAVSPAFDLLVRVDNGHIFDQYREGGSVTVSYAGVPVAHGRTPSFRVGAKAALNFTVIATSNESVGVPEDLFRLMSAERRWGAAQLDVCVQLGWPGWESYSWSIDLDG